MKRFVDKGVELWAKERIGYLERWFAWRPQPDTMYTQALIHGHQVILNLGGDTYAYHLKNKGVILLCENALPHGAAGSTPTEWWPQK